MTLFEILMCVLFSINAIVTLVCLILPVGIVDIVFHVLIVINALFGVVVVIGAHKEWL